MLGHSISGRGCREREGGVAPPAKGSRGFVTENLQNFICKILRMSAKKLLVGTAPQYWGTAFVPLTVYAYEYVCKFCS